jgi:phosphoglucosamine mutase
MHPEQLCQLVRQHKAHLGMAHDGDADRVLLCDERGRLIDGDDVLAILGLERLAEGSLRGKTVVATVMSNAGLETVIQRAGGRLLRTQVGDQNVLAAMLAHDYNLGGEQSGHIILRDYSTTGDGLLAALQVLRAMKTSGKALSQLAACWARFPQLLTNLVVREKKPFDEVDGLAALLRKAEAELQSHGGRILLRYSGTEPKVRLLLEGPQAPMLQRWNGKIAKLLQAELGAGAG